MSQDEGYYYYSGYYQDYYYSRNPEEQADEAKTATTVAKLNPESSGDAEIKQKI